MPTYVYGPTNGDKRTCDVCSGSFEIVQRMVEDALTKCPKCGAEVQRIIMAPNLSGAGAMKKPTDANLARAGFTQYKKKGNGYYEKSFGSGPSALHP